MFAQNINNEFESKIDSVNRVTENPKTYNLLEYLQNENLKLIYESDFGETTCRIEKNDTGYLDINENDDFTYIQEMKFDDDGVYLLKADQHVEVLLFISKDIETIYPTTVKQLPKKISKGEISGQTVDEESKFFEETVNYLEI